MKTLKYIRTVCHLHELDGISANSQNSAWFKFSCSFGFAKSVGYYCCHLSLVAKGAAHTNLADKWEPLNSTPSALCGGSQRLFLRVSLPIWVFDLMHIYAKRRLIASLALLTKVSK